MRCLETEREERPSSVRELRDALAAVSGRERWSRERAAAWWQAHSPLAATVRDSSLKS
jgi:hypothetical protein